jgi:hypothetical protein
MTVEHAQELKPAVQWLRLPHWGLLLASAVILFVVGIALTLVLPAIASNRLIRRLLAADGRVGYSHADRPNWLPSAIRDSEAFLPSFDRITSLKVQPSSESDAIELLRFAPELKELMISVDRNSVAGLSSVARLALLEDLELDVADLDSSELEPLKPLRRLTSVYLRGRAIDDTAIAMFADNRLQRLFLEGQGQPLGAAGLRALAHKSTLEALILSGVRLEPGAQDALSEFPNVTNLLLYDVGLAASKPLKLADLKQLEFVQIHNTPIEDDALLGAAAWRRIRLIDLSGAKISDAGVAHLTAASSLTNVDLSRTKITDSAAGSLIALPKLWSLSLAGTEVGDLMLQQLALHPQLRGLDVRSTRCTLEGIATFRTARPDVEVTCDFDGADPTATE